MTIDTTLLVLAKAPRPGRVKTRLIPAYSPAQAAALAAAALADTLAVVAAAPARRRVLVLDGGPIEDVPAGFEVVPQAPGGLDARLAAALSLADGPALLVGMDTPQLRVEHLAADWTAYDAWLGDAVDGGFWALGVRCPEPALLRRVLLGVPMSTGWTGALTRRRLRGVGLRLGELPPLRDVDTAVDAAAVAALAPDTRFAALVRTYGAAPRLEPACVGEPA